MQKNKCAGGLKKWIFKKGLLLVRFCTDRPLKPNVGAGCGKGLFLTRLLPVFYPHVTRVTPCVWPCFGRLFTAVRPAGCSCIPLQALGETLYCSGRNKGKNMIKNVRFCTVKIFLLNRYEGMGGVSYVDACISRNN